LKYKTAHLTPDAYRIQQLKLAPQAGGHCVQIWLCCTLYRSTMPHQAEFKPHSYQGPLPKADEYLLRRGRVSNEFLNDGQTLI